MTIGAGEVMAARDGPPQTRRDLQPSGNRPQGAVRLSGNQRLLFWQGANAGKSVCDNDHTYVYEFELTMNGVFAPDDPALKAVTQLLSKYGHICGGRKCFTTAECLRLYTCMHLIKYYAVVLP